MKKGKKNKVRAIWLNSIDFLFLAFSNLSCMVEAKIITLPNVDLNVYKGIIFNYYIMRI